MYQIVHILWKVLDVQLTLKNLFCLKVIASLLFHMASRIHWPLVISLLALCLRSQLDNVMYHRLELRIDGRSQFDKGVGNHCLPCLLHFADEDDLAASSHISVTRVCPGSTGDANLSLRALKR